jgi:hypothetical protein
VTEPALPCPKCQGQLVQGYVVEGIHEGVALSMWIIGQPTSDLFTRLKLTDAKMPIGTFRCQSCGYLEPISE